MDDNRLAKIVNHAKMEDQTTPGQLDGLQNVDAKVKHQHYRRTGALDKIQEVSYKKKRKENIFIE